MESLVTFMTHACTFVIIFSLHIIRKQNLRVHIEIIIMLHISVIITRDTEPVEFVFRNIEELVKISPQQVALTKSVLIFGEGKRTLSPVYIVEIKCH